MSKRTADKQITKDNADNSDSNSESEAQKVREKAPQEVLATRKIVSVKRGGVAKPAAPISVEETKSPKNAPVGGLFAGLSGLTAQASGDSPEKPSLFSGLGALTSPPKESLFSGLSVDSPKKESGLFGSLFSAPAGGEGLFASSFSFSAPQGDAFPSFGGADSKQGTPEESAGEEQIYQNDCKLYKLQKEDEGPMKWVEKCIGFVRLLRHKDSRQLRLVVRMKGVFRLALNVALVPALCKPEPVGNKSVRFNGVDESNSLGMYRLNLITEDQQVAFLALLQ